MTLLSAVVLAFGDEPLLVECVEALLASTGVDLEVVLVDNGCTGDAVGRLRDRARVQVLDPGRNLGFTGGCNLAAERSEGDVLVLVNSDAVVRPDALSHLVTALDDPSVGIATGCLRLRDRPDVVNSAGNPVHYLGLSWAGGHGEPATSYATPRPVASASGGLLALRRETWVRLGGFFGPLFAYAEDLDLSLRCWQHGLRVVYVPAAVAGHAYEFSRNPRKLYLLERNRLAVVLTVYQGRTLALLALPLLGLELAMVAVAVRQGWAKEKLRGWAWLLGHARLLRRRRREVQRSRRESDAVLVPLLTDRFTPGAELGLAAPRPVQLVSVLAWRLLRRGIGQSANTDKSDSLPSRP